MSLSMTREPREKPRPLMRWRFGNLQGPKLPVFAQSRDGKILLDQSGARAGLSRLVGYHTGQVAITRNELAVLGDSRRIKTVSVFDGRVVIVLDGVSAVRFRSKCRGSKCRD